MPSSRRKSRTKSKTLEELYDEELRDLYDAENRIVKALPKLAKESSSDELRAAFEEHLEQTRGHVERLVQIFKRMGERPRAKTCDGIKGIIEEGSEILELEGGASKDAGLIGGAQRVEHYEMAAYGTVRTWAQQLGRGEDAQLLQQTLDEEKATDEKLSQIAQSINASATADEESGAHEGPKENRRMSVSAQV
jgi:ferritin-like metal-binding protein YciE